MDKQTVVVVDDNIANLAIVRSLLKGRYEVFPIPSASILFEYLDKAVPDLILLDVEMPGMDGYEVIQKLKSDSRFDDVPVIFLTSHEDEASELEGLSLGAVDYVSKPFSPPLLLKRIENHLLIGSQKKKLENYNKNLEVMVEEKTEHIRRMQERLLTILAEMVEFRDSVTGEHIDRTQKYLKILIDRMLELGVYREELEGWNTAFLIPSAQLHDIGKIAISDTILDKPGKLTREEFEIIKTHAAVGVQIIERIERETQKDIITKNGMDRGIQTVFPERISRFRAGSWRLPMSTTLWFRRVLIKNPCRSIWRNPLSLRRVESISIRQS